jgi:hypothetical protein
VTALSRDWITVEPAEVSIWEAQGYKVEKTCRVPRADARIGSLISGTRPVVIMSRWRPAIFPVPLSQAAEVG